MKLAFIVISLLLRGMLPAGAEPVHPCQADRDRFCPGKNRDVIALSKCLREHAAELSRPCVDYNDIYRARATDLAPEEASGSDPKQ